MVFFSVLILFHPKYGFPFHMPASFSKIGPTFLHPLQCELYIYTNSSLSELRILWNDEEVNLWECTS